MTRRIVAITVAIALAALGAAGGLFLILTADKRAQDRLQDGVTVAVANGAMSVGTSGAKARADNLIRMVRFPRANVPADALTDFATNTGYDRLVLTANVAANQLLLKTSFGEVAKVGNALPLPDGKLALSLQAGGAQQVGGYIKPGNEVAVFLTYSATAGGVKRMTTKTLLAPVQVIAVTSSVVTIAVTQTEAEKLILATTQGSLYLGLLGDSGAVKPDNGVDNVE